jgi:hypothetical protein
MRASVAQLTACVTEDALRVIDDFIAIQPPTDPSDAGNNTPVFISRRGNVVSELLCYPILGGEVPGTASERAVIVDAEAPCA